MKNGFINSCMNYTGNKHKLLPQMTRLFPEKVDTFVDMFCGSLSVGINAKANYIIANDKSSHIIELFQLFKNEGYEKSLAKIKSIIEEYNLSRTGKEEYLKLRETYNSSKVKDPYMFYVLVCHSFNNQIRFNKSKGFNLPFGARTFNPSIENKFEEFIKQLCELNIDFFNEDFRDIELTNLTKDDFVYFDCPYIISTASYNENGGWKTKDESDLLQYIDKLGNTNWALSNVTHHKGETNDLLIEFAKAYNVHEMKINYYNCSYRKMNDSTITREVLITNY